MDTILKFDFLEMKTSTLFQKLSQLHKNDINLNVTIPHKGKQQQAVTHATLL